jgi:hypothetical protein
MVKILGIIGIVFLVLVSIVVGALLGAFVGAVYVPVKVVSILTGDDNSSETNDVDDSI